MTQTHTLRRGLILTVTFAMVSCEGFLPGCDPVADGPDPEDTGDCFLFIEETWPQDSSTDFYTRGDIEFLLDDWSPLAQPVLSLTRAGQAVAGESWLSEDAGTVYFTPAAPLEPSTEYTATLTSCQGEASIDFLTSTLGPPLEEGLEGRTNLVNPLGGRVVEPPGFGDVIITLVGQPNILVEVQRADDLLVFLGAVTEGHGAEQDPCAPTIAFPPADFSEAPYFEVPPSLVDIEVDGTVVSLHEFTMAGTFAADGTWFGGGVIGGELDMRDRAALVPEVESPEELCELTASFGAPCQPCTGDGEILCLPVLIDRLEGFELPVDVVEVTDPTENPDCL